MLERLQCWKGYNIERTIGPPSSPQIGPPILEGVQYWKGYNVGRTTLLDNFH